MIDHPRPAEKEMLVALTEATGFFGAQEMRIVREMLDAFFAAPENGEYVWIVYREAPHAPPIGYACYGPAALAVGVYDLYWIVVERAQQGKGIGTALLEYMEADLRRRGARQVYIETSDRAQYAPTRAFYERRGYRVAARFEDYYDVGDGKVVYVKKLT